MFKGLRQLFSNSSESLDCSLSSTETIISEDEQLEDGTATYPTTKMEGNVQKTNTTEESVVGAENDGATKQNHDSTELEGLKIRRKYHRGSLTKSISKFQSAIDSGEETSTILGAHCAVKLRYDSLREIEERIQKLSPVEVIEEELSSFSAYEENYEATLAFVEHLKFGEAQHSHINSTFTPKVESEQREVKLQSLTLPKFSGKEGCKVDFFEFMELFAVVTERYSDTAKAVLLKNHVVFPAAGTFGGLLATAENYPIMVSKLNQKFGSPAIRLNKFVRKLLEYAPPKPSQGSELSANSLRAIVDELSTIVRNLRLIDESSLTSENLIISLVQLKLPQRILIELNLGRDPSSPYSLDELFEAIENSVRSRELAELSEKKSRDNTFKPRRERALAVNVKDGKTSPPCLFCSSKAHPTRLCNTPKVKPSERFQVLIKNKHCVYCLNLGHHKSDCSFYKKKALSCRTCNSREHSTLMHLDKKPPFKRVNFSNEPRTKIAPPSNKEEDSVTPSA